jgi:hypothetical protein
MINIQEVIVQPFDRVGPRPTAWRAPHAPSGLGRLRGLGMGEAQRRQLPLCASGGDGSGPALNRGYWHAEASMSYGSRTRPTLENNADMDVFTMEEERGP